MNRLILNCNYTVEDDHLYLNFYNYGKEFNLNFWELFLKFQNMNFVFGRFEPVFMSILMLKANICGLNAPLNYTLIVLVNVFTGFFLYRSLIILNINFTVAFICALVYLTGSTYSEIFWRLNAAENHANLFLIVGIFFQIKYVNHHISKNFYWSLLFLTLAALTKESYILLLPIIVFIPLIILFKDLNQTLEVIRQNAFKFIITILIFIAIVAGLFLIVLFKGKVFNYGKALGLVDTLLNNSKWIWSWFIPFLLPILFASVLLIFKKKTSLFIKSILIVLILFAAHLIIYHQVIISFSQGRYLMPFALFQVFLLAFALDELFKNNKIIFYAMILFTLLIVIRNAKIIYINGAKFEAKAASYNKMIDYISEKKPKSLAVVGGFEFFTSLEANFAVKGYTPKLIYVMPNKSDKVKVLYENSKFEKSLENEMIEKYGLADSSYLNSCNKPTMCIFSEPASNEVYDESFIKRFYAKQKYFTKGFKNLNFSDFKNPSNVIGNSTNDSVSYVLYY